MRTILGEARCPGWLFPVERVALVRLFLAMGGDGWDVAVPGYGEVVRVHLDSKDLMLLMLLLWWMSLAPKTNEVPGKTI